MKKLFSFILLLMIVTTGHAQQVSGCEQFTSFKKNSQPDLAIVIYTNDIETAWNAMRLATFSQAKGDSVVIFLLGKGLDGFQMKDKNFDLEPLKETFVGNGGQIIACGSCAKIRGTDEIGMCTISGMADLYAIINRSKKIISF